MSASNEWFVYHLTPNGWVKGSEKVDVAGVTVVSMPNDTYVTVTIHERMASINSKIDRWEDRQEKEGSRELIDSLYEKYGKDPRDK